MHHRDTLPCELEESAGKSSQRYSLITDALLNRRYLDRDILATLLRVPLLRSPVVDVRMPLLLQKEEVILTDIGRFDTMLLE